MTDQLNMAGLTLADSKHANGYPAPAPNTRSAYIPPHLRGMPQGPPGPPGPPIMDGPPMMNGNMNGSAWGPPPHQEPR